MSKLEKIIEEQEEEIQTLKERIEWFEQVKYTMLPQTIDENEINKIYPGYIDLPFPRFEMQINPLNEDGSNVEWIYGILYKSMGDDSLIFIPFSRTTGSGRNYKNIEEPEFPFRDGLNIRVEMKLFNLRGYILFNGKIKEIDDGDYTERHIADMARNITRQSKLSY